MGERAGGGQGEAGDDRQDRGEGDGGDDGQDDRPTGLTEEDPTDLLGQLRGRGIAARALRDDRLRADQRRCAEAQGNRHQVEAADDADCPQHRLPGRLGVRHRVEAGQDVRQAGGAEHQGDAQRHQVELAVDALGSGAVTQARVEEGLALAAPVRRGPEQRADAAAVVDHHQNGHQGGAGHQHHRLDDLHPGGALHPADRDVEDHQSADGHDGDVLRRLAVDTEQQADQRPRADHLGQQVEDRHGDRRDACGDAHRPLPHPERQDVGHRVLAAVAQQFRDQQQGHQPGDQEADGVQETVVPGQRDDAGDAEEARGRHVVAADRDAVLRAGQ